MGFISKKRILFLKNSSRKSLNINNDKPIAMISCIELPISESFGVPKSVNILHIAPHASLILGILKNTHAKFTNKKVKHILIAFTTQLCPSYFCHPNAFSTIWNSPCIQPQTINVQFAPCQMPLTRKVTKMFQ